MTINFSLIGAAWAAEEGAAAGDGSFPPFDSSLFASQLFWLAVSFGAFYFLMARVVIPRVGGILETRSDRISQDLDEAQRLKEESEAAIAAYEHELAEARNRAHAIGAEARDRAKAEADAKREEVEAELAKKLEEAEKTIASIKKEALAEVDGIAISTADEILSTLVSGGATKAEVEKAVKTVSKGEADV